MNLNEFRNETRAWIQNNLPKEISGRPDGFSGGNKGGTQSSDHKRWFDACYERGFTVPTTQKNEFSGKKWLQRALPNHWEVWALR